MPQPKNNINHQVLWTASDGWGLIFFLTSSPNLDLGHFSQVILPIVLLIMPQLSGAGQSIWWLGLFFFDLFSHSGLRRIFHKWFCQLYYKLCPSPKIIPTIRCCEQHLMVGVNFFLTCSPILDLGHFSQVILPIVLQIMPQLSGAVHSIWWLGFSFYLFSHSGLRAFFTDDFANCTTVYAQPPGAVHSIWWLGLFFFDLFSRSGLRAFCLQVILPIVLQIMPPQKNNPNHQVLWTASDGWG